MIISHKNEYLFVELQHTASSAISRELRLNYDGESILRKHARYHEFLRKATTEEKTYFVFSGLRNPLDTAVSIYFKLKTNHNGQFTNPKWFTKNGGYVSNDYIKIFKFVRETNADFPTFLKRYYKTIYHNTSLLSHRNFDSIIRFENLQEDFARTLEKLGLEQIRELPVVNKTKGKKEDFLSFYPPEIHQYAKNTFGPFMQYWGYKFPPSWGESTFSWSSQCRFYMIWALKSIYWRLIRDRFKKTLV